MSWGLVMKVLHVVSNIAVGNGIMTVLMNYYSHIDRNSIQFDFLFFEHREITFEDRIKSLGGKVYKLPDIRNVIEFRRGYNQFCKNVYGQYDIAHIHDCFMISFLIDIKKKANVNALVVHSHNPRLSDNLVGEIRNRILSLPNYFIPDYYMACSKQSGEYAFGKRFKNGMVLNNAIDLPQYQFDERKREYTRKELEFDGKIVIGNIAGFRKQKNHRFLLEVFKEILAIEPNSELVLVGEGHLKNDIVKLSEDLGLRDKTVFMGTRDDIPELLCAFDIMLLPSLYEGFGIVLIEAQAAGLPCVYSDMIPKETNIVKERNTILSLGFSAKIWADAVFEAIKIDRHIDQDSINMKIGKKGFDISREAEKLRLKYEELLLINS